MKSYSVSDCLVTLTCGGETWVIEGNSSMFTTQAEEDWINSFEPVSITVNIIPPKIKEKKYTQINKVWYRKERY